MLTGANCFFTDTPSTYMTTLHNNLPHFNDTSQSLQALKSQTNFNILNFFLKNTNNSESHDLLKLVYTFYLTFESYDSQTKIADIYMPNEKVVTFPYSTLKFNFKGKLRLSYEKHYYFILDRIPQAPTDTYGAIESNELVISLDRVCQCQYLFIRGSEIKLTAQRKQAYINAYLNGVNVYKTSINQVLPLAWTRIDFPNVEFNQLVLPGGFDIDNLRFTYQSTEHYNLNHFMKYLNRIEKQNIVK